MAFGDILDSGGGGGATASWTAPGTRSLVLLNFSQGDGGVGITTAPAGAVEIDSEIAAVTSGYWVGYLIDEAGSSTGASITWAAEDGDEGHAYLIVDIGTSTLTTPVPNVFGGDLTGTVSAVNAAITPAATLNILAAFLHTDAGNQWDSADVGTVGGEHDGSAGAAALADSTLSLTTDELVGLTIQNITDGSSGTITGNTATAITGTLSGGTLNNWQVGDVYLVSGPFTQPAGSAMRNDADSATAIAIAANRPVAQQRAAFARTGTSTDQAGIILADFSFAAAAANAGLRIRAKANAAGSSDFADTTDIRVVVYDAPGGTELLDTATAAVSSGIMAIDSDSVGSVDDTVFVVIYKAGVVEIAEEFTVVDLDESPAVYSD